MKYERKIKTADAVYTDGSVVSNNPCIDALPFARGYKELAGMMESYLQVEDSTEFSEDKRKEFILNATRFYVPLSKSLEIAEMMFHAITQGYVTRNPLLGEWKRNMGLLQDAVFEKDVALNCLADCNANEYGFCIVGESGMGKTTAVKSVLANIPQVILHSEYKGKPFEFIQLTWLKLECPHDGSIKGLCMEFFSEYDKVLDDDSRKRVMSGRASTDDMILRMADLAEQHNLGLLVIDEIQNIRSAKSGGAQKFKNLLTQMMNKLGIPILIIGTPSMIAELTTEVKTARRFCGQGLVGLFPLKDGSFDWKRFTEELWKYQYTKKKIEWSEELASELHKYSYGNIDAAIKLFIRAQKLAIDNKEDKISKSLISEAAEEDGNKLVLKLLKDDSEAKKKSNKIGSQFSELQNLLHDGISEYERTALPKDEPLQKVKLTPSDEVKDYDYHSDMLSEEDEL